MRSSLRSIREQQAGELGDPRKLLTDLGYEEGLAEKLSGVTATARNSSTVTKLLEPAGE